MSATISRVDTERIPKTESRDMDEIKPDICEYYKETCNDYSCEACKEELKRIEEAFALYLDNLREN